MGPVRRASKDRHAAQHEVQGREVRELDHQ
jgi:hypothetical protein